MILFKSIKLKNSFMGFFIYVKLSKYSLKRYTGDNNRRVLKWVILVND